MFENYDFNCTLAADRGIPISQRSFKTKCDLEVDTFGLLRLESAIDLCSKPPLLNIIIRMHRYIWKMTFSPQGRRGGESRLFGPDYYPMRMHVNFHPGHYSINDTATMENGQQNLRVKCCLEAMKPSWSTCYLDTTVVSATTTDKDCQSRTLDSIQLFRISPQLSVFCVFLVALLLLSIFALSMAFKRYKKAEKYRKNIQRTKQNLLIIPKLPGAKLYQEKIASTDQITKDLGQKACDQEETLSHSNSTITEQNTNLCRNRLDFLRNLKMRESKLIQTSCTSLETEIMILSRSTNERMTNNDRSSDYTSPTSSGSQKSSESGKLLYDSGKGNFISV